jgi:plastocyanin
VVYLEGGKAKPKPAEATVIMKGKQFIPRVTVVPVGSTVAFPNQDPIFHNVFSVSGTNRFDLINYKRPESKSWRFEHPGLVRVYCNIHPQMSAAVYVVDTPFWTRAAKDGSFTIPDVPPGKYTLRAWHERGGETSTEIEVPKTEPLSVKVALDATKHKKVQHKNKFGKDYSTSEGY